MADIPIIAIMAPKGGVGKTALTISLAAQAALVAQRRVRVVDADTQADSLERLIPHVPLSQRESGTIHARTAIPGVEVVWATTEGELDAALIPSEGLDVILVDGRPSEGAGVAVAARARVVIVPILDGDRSSYHHAAVFERDLRAARPDIRVIYALIRGRGRVYGPDAPPIQLLDDPAVEAWAWPYVQSPVWRELEEALR